MEEKVLVVDDDQHVCEMVRIALEAEGFIVAEAINWKDLLEAGSLSAAKEKGILRVEGKGYNVEDGDVILFRFKV